MTPVSHKELFDTYLSKCCSINAGISRYGCIINFNDILMIACGFVQYGCKGLHSVSFTDTKHVNQGQQDRMYQLRE